MHRSLCLKFGIFIATLLLADQSRSGELDFLAGVDLSYVDQSTESKEDDIKISAINTIIQPFAALLYNGKDLRLNARITNNHVSRKVDDESISQDYTEYNYSGRYSVIDNLLLVSINGLETFRSNALNSFLVDDFLLNADSLNKVKSDSANFTFNIRRNEIIGFVANGSYSKTTSSIDSTAGQSDPSIFANETYGINFNVISGEGLNNVKIEMLGSVRYSKRDIGQNFVSQSLGLDIDTALYESLALALTSFYENNEIKTDFELPFNSLREFYSYGAGLIWQASTDRFIEITLNKSFNKAQLDDDDDDETDTFIGYSVNWAFSPRTRLRGAYTRRFFGDAGNLSFRHQLRNWRSSINYNEIVSSTSQLINSQGTGLFICDSGNTDFSSCRLSEDLNPTLEADQSLVPLIIPTVDLNDRIIIRKSLTAQTAVSRRRTTLSIVGTISEDEEVEINRVLDVNSLSLQLNFRLSDRSSISLTNLYSSVEQNLEGELEKAITRKQEIRFNRAISKRFSTALSFSYLDREGEINRGFQEFRGLNGSLTDRRVTLSLSYLFGEQERR